MSNVLRAAPVLIVLVGSVAWGQGRAPEKKSSQPPPASHPVKTAKDNTNEALDHMDQGIHEALHESKDAANNALNAVDKGVHKVIGSPSQ